MATASQNVVVTRPTMAAQMADVAEGADGTVTNQVIAAFEVPDATDPASWFAATIAWADGTTSAGVIGGGNGSFTVAGGHAYATPGDHVVGVTVQQRWFDYGNVVALRGLARRAAVNEKDTKAYWVAKADAAIAGYKAALPRGASSLDIAIARNKYITAAYAKIYQQDPKAFLWAGLASLASNEVGAALVELDGLISQIYGSVLWAPLVAPLLVVQTSVAQLTAYRIVSKTAALLGEGNLAVYDDVYWQFLAYANGGLNRMNALAKNGELTKDQLAVWVKVAGKDWSGAGLDMFENEQLNLLQPFFDQMPTLAARAAAEKSKPLFPGATSFRGSGGDNIADKGQRWDDWIVPKLWPQWVKYSEGKAGQAWITATMNALKKP